MKSSRGVIPPHVEQVVMRALEKRPDARFPTIEQMMFAIADPVGYVEAHGGLGAFRGTKLDIASQSTLHMTGSRIAPLTPTPLPAVAPHSQTTTLGGAAAEIGEPPRRRRTPLVLGLVAAFAAAGGIAAVALNRGGGDAKPSPEPTEAAQEAPAPEAPSTETPPAPPDPGPEATPPPVPGEVAPAKTITIVVESTPPGATVTVAGEKTPRGKTPYTFEIEASDRELELELALDGYEAETKRIALTGNTTVGVDLDKKARRGRTGKRGGTTGQAGTADEPSDSSGSDDTLNPFEKKRGTP
jgi:hypothetical protein